MRLGRTWSTALVGLRGHVVEVEAHLAAGLPAFTLVGLPDTSLGEARERVRAAVTSCGIAWPNRRATVNLAPASLPKSGPTFDLAIAVAVLQAAELLDATRSEGAAHLGELGLDGRVHPVRGVLPAVLAAVRKGVTRVVVPAANAAEARLVPGADVLAVEHLADLVAAYGGEATRLVAPERAGAGPLPLSAAAPPEAAVADLADVLGQGNARYALEVAAAGGHHLLLVGPPGAGKTMLASRLPGILPDLAEPESVEVTSVHSIAGTFDPRRGLMVRPPFESPHHTATPAAIVGGGSGVPRPGAASRAHRGVLFLDEAPEFASRVLETLRQPLENGELVLQRAQGTARYPARFQLVLAANPCPCGKGGGKGIDCTCTSLERRRYFGRLSGPLLDRVDLQVEVPAMGRAALALAPGDPSSVVAERVRAAREAAAHRLRGTPWRTSGEASGAWLRKHAPLPHAVVGELQTAMERGRLSLLGMDRVLRVAWTVADLAGRGRPTRDDVDSALALRNGDHRA